MSTIVSKASTPEYESGWDAIWGKKKTVNTVHQYFYKNEACPALTANEPNCICWHNEGTGPYSHVDAKFADLQWREIEVEVDQKL